MSVRASCAAVLVSAPAGLSNGEMTTSSLPVGWLLSRFTKIGALGCTASVSSSEGVSTVQDGQSSFTRAAAAALCCLDASNSVFWYTTTVAPGLVLATAYAAWALPAATGSLDTLTMPVGTLPHRMQTIGMFASWAAFTDAATAAGVIAIRMMPSTLSSTALLMSCAWVVGANLPSPGASAVHPILAMPSVTF